MPTLMELRTRLAEAEVALHKLSTGEREVEVEVGGFGRTEYSEVNMRNLERYIARLKNEIAMKEGKGGRRPLLISF